MSSPYFLFNICNMAKKKNKKIDILPIKKRLLDKKMFGDIPGVEKSYRRVRHDALHIMYPNSKGRPVNGPKQRVQGPFASVTNRATVDVGTRDCRKDAICHGTGGVHGANRSLEAVGCTDDFHRLSLPLRTLIPCHNAFFWREE